MRILVLSDIHSNLAALEAVLAAAGAFDRLWCLGDLVGYGPEPEACIRRLRSFDPLCLAGNHDLAALGRLSVEDFNRAAKAAALWTGSRIEPESALWLGSLAPIAPLAEFGITLVHGAPGDPVWGYIVDRQDASDSLAALGTRLCFNGHTHVPVIFREVAAGRLVTQEAPRRGRPVELGRGRILVNPGSVGQPRDGDPRASFGVLDSEAMSFLHCRVEYEVARTQRRMEEEGLPESLVSRLAFGR